MPNVIDTTCLCRKSKFDCAKITMIDRQRRCPNWANQVVLQAGQAQLAVSPIPANEIVTP